MDITRRNFLGLTALGSLSVATGPGLASSSHREPIDNSKVYGVLIDTVLCIGCRKCEWACNQEHKLSDTTLPEFEDKSVFAEHRRPSASTNTVVNEFSSPDDPTGKKYQIKVQCMHCNYPACESACIVGAFEKMPNGTVRYDAWKCIGCRYCMIACPFQIPAYEYSKAIEPRVIKCTFCLHLLEDGKRPACVEICPKEALVFGTREQVIQLAHQRIQSHPEKYSSHVYGEHEAGGTSWIYLLPYDFKHTELPALDDSPLPDKTERIQHGIFKAFVPPLALYGLLGLIMYTRKRDKSGEEN